MMPFTWRTVNLSPVDRSQSAPGHASMSAHVLPVNHAAQPSRRRPRSALRRIMHPTTTAAPSFCAPANRAPKHHGGALVLRSGESCTQPSRWRPRSALRRIMHPTITVAPSFCAPANHAPNHTARPHRCRPRPSIECLSAGMNSPCAPSPGNSPASPSCVPHAVSTTTVGPCRRRPASYGPLTGCESRLGIAAPHVGPRRPRLSAVGHGYVLHRLSSRLLRSVLE